MKKIISTMMALLLICICFTSCTGEKKPEEPTPTGKYFMLNKLPDIGNYKGDEVITYYFSSGPNKTFTPNKDYGGIVPYYGQSHTFYLEAYEDYMTNYFSGIAAADGSIITDVIYSSIYYDETPKGKGFFFCEKFAEDEENRFYDIISADGKAMLQENVREDIESGTFALDIGPKEGIIISTNEGRMLYNTDLDLVMNITEAFGADCYLNPIYYDGSRIIVDASTSGAEGYYCMDMSGNLIYTIEAEDGVMYDYNNGYFVYRSFDNDEVFLYDVLGNKYLEDKNYTGIIQLGDGERFWGYDEEKNVLELVKADGEVIGKAEGKIPFDPMFNVVTSDAGRSLFISGDEEGEYLWLEIETGKEIKIDGEKPEDVFTTDETADAYIVFEYGDSADIYNSVGTYLTSLGNVEKFAGSGSGQINYVGKDGKMHIKDIKSKKDYTLKTDEEIGEDHYVWFSNGDYIGIYKGNEKTDMYRIETGELVYRGIDNPEIYYVGGEYYYNFYCDGKYILLDKNGKVLISINDKTSV